MSSIDHNVADFTEGTDVSDDSRGVKRQKISDETFQSLPAQDNDPSKPILLAEEMKAPVEMKAITEVQDDEKTIQKPDVNAAPVTKENEKSNSDSIIVERIDEQKEPSQASEAINPEAVAEKTVSTTTLTENKVNAKSKVEIVTQYVKLEELPRRIQALPKLSNAEKHELEVALQLDAKDEDEWWRDDWAGNLALMSKEVSNPSTKRRKPQKTETTQTLWEWAHGSNSAIARKLGRNLLALVYHQAPSMAQKILGHVSTCWENDVVNFDIFEAIKRCSYDPDVLREDGWTTSPHGDAEETASGGPTNIGKKVHWQGYEAVIIAYVHDNEYGDLWKAMWIDGCETFDLEADELQEAIRKWERKNKKTETKREQTTDTATRFDAVKDFSVENIEHGIVMATTYDPGARQGVFWPARIMHVSELDKSITQNKRSSAKQKIHVVFLAPYWCPDGVSARNANFSSFPLFQMESIDVSYDTIQRYPHDGRRGLNIHQLRVAFRFTGLPKNAFGRFLDSHRLAMSLKLFAEDELVATTIKAKSASAALFDTHPLAVNTAHFPLAILNLPFYYILSKLKAPSKQQNAANHEEDNIEPVLQLSLMLKAMEPPRCFGEKPDSIQPQITDNETGYKNKNVISLLASPDSKGLLTRMDSSKITTGDDLSARSLLSEFLSHELDKLAKTDLPSASLLEDLEKLVLRAKRIIETVSGEKVADVEIRNLKLKSLLQECLRMKSYGEDILAADSSLLERHSKSTLTEWRKSCERLFKYITLRCSSTGFGNGVTVVLSDSRCNEHITKNGCVERPVRLPAALKGAKLAGAGSTPSFPFLNGIEEHYLQLATEKFLGKAHTVSYLRKIQARCTAIATGVNGAHLTEGSDGEGGCDTTGSRGTWDAAVAGVAAAMKAVDLIVGGHCVNAFCATRPPGHHAGRDLHPMGAVSNGFCVLNPVAVAAIYATTPPSEGGLGLKRAVVIDFDVHHGNGTQDILCSTYDPRFLYVSMHAGGALINGYETDDSERDFPSVGNKKQEGIYPGRCGDTSPHKGVINLPLGAKVTPHDVGNALVTVIEPAVEAFSPDIIILSAGFDGHKNDPLGMGGLSAHDFGHITEVACGMAFRFCSGRIMSILEGGYGVPCCRPQKDLFLPPALETTTAVAQIASSTTTQSTVEIKRVQPSKLLDLEGTLPSDMDDQVTPGMVRKLEKCHTEGFIECIQEHVSSLKKNNSRA